MRSFNNLPIKGKLTLVMVLTSATVLLLVCLAAVAYQFAQFHKTIARDLNTEAEILGVNTAAALVFNDPKAARETLTVLKYRREIVSARLFRTDGRLLAEYVRSGYQSPVTLPPLGTRFEYGQAILCEPVWLENDLAGYVCLRADLAAQKASFRAYAGIVLGVLVASLFIALVLANRLQRLISEPVLTLAAVARQVSEGKDYSLRAPRQTDDEIGYLTEEFNEMLARIGRREAALQASEERFRQIAENIAEVFWMTNPEKTQMLYISRRYEQVWGRTCESLQARPMDWVEAIHPEDQPRVLQTALKNQAGGNYDEQYRIVRPNGEVRWIHDRAFPVRDEQGQIYRLAGIAEDVTARRHLENEILQISEREQARIGQDLHDGLCQHLLRAAIAGNLLEQDLTARRIPEAASAQKLSKLLQDALTQTRTVARGLFPVKLEGEGLASALLEMAASLRQHSPIRFTVDCAPPVLVADHNVAVHLYRIAQEAVSNALRHAAPQEIVISLREREQKIQLEIRDDGLGLPENCQRGLGLGLSIMAYRAHMIGGTLAMHRRLEGGTLVTCSVTQNSV